MVVDIARSCPTRDTRVMALFHRYKADARPATKKFVASAIPSALLVHARIEEEIFLIATFSGMQATDPQFDLTFMELMRSVIHHVADEETMLLTRGAFTGRALAGA